jgi:hypothetical protein
MFEPRVVPEIPIIEAIPAKEVYCNNLIVEEIDGVNVRLIGLSTGRACGSGALEHQVVSRQIVAVADLLRAAALLRKAGKVRTAARKAEAIIRMVPHHH